MAKGLDVAAAKDLIGQALRLHGGDAVAKRAGPVVEAAFEVARESSRAAGRRTLTIRGVSVHSGDDVVFQVVDSGPKKPTPTDAGPRKPLPIAYGDSHKTCYLVSTGPQPYYFCIYF